MNKSNFLCVKLFPIAGETSPEELVQSHLLIGPGDPRVKDMNLTPELCSKFLTHPSFEDTSTISLMHANTLNTHDHVFEVLDVVRNVARDSWGFPAENQDEFM